MSFMIGEHTGPSLTQRTNGDRIIQHNGYKLMQSTPMIKPIRIYETSRKDQVSQSISSSLRIYQLSCFVCGMWMQKFVVARAYVVLNWSHALVSWAMVLEISLFDCEHIMFIVKTVGTLRWEYKNHTLLGITKTIYSMPPCYPFINKMKYTK